jgi:hypothetical protein
MDEDKKFRVYFRGEKVGVVYAQDEDQAIEVAEESIDVVEVTE